MLIYQNDHNQAPLNLNTLFPLTKALKIVNTSPIIRIHSRNAYKYTTRAPSLHHHGKFTSNNTIKQRNSLIQVSPFPIHIQITTIYTYSQS